MGRRGLGWGKRQPGREGRIEARINSKAYRVSRKENVLGICAGTQSPTPHSKGCVSVPKPVKKAHHILGESNKSR